MSERVALRLVLPGAVVTSFVTGFRISLQQKGSEMAIRIDDGFLSWEEVVGVIAAA